LTLTNDESGRQRSKVTGSFILRMNIIHRDPPRSIFVAFVGCSFTSSEVEEQANHFALLLVLGLHSASSRDVRGPIRLLLLDHRYLMSSILVSHPHAHAPSRAPVLKFGGLLACCIGWGDGVLGPFLLSCEVDLSASVLYSPFSQLGYAH
jgi:hypothetical protein